MIKDLKNPLDWQAYSGYANIHALQAFYTRELSGHGWEIEEFIPFSNPMKNPFAQLNIKTKNSARP